MARLSLPNRQGLMADLTDGQTVQPDPVTTVTRDGDGILATLSADGTDVALAFRTTPVERWTLLATQRAGATKRHAALALPEPIIRRINRLMSADGPSIQRDWRTGTHVLRAGYRQVIPVTHGDVIAAALTPTGYRAMTGTAADRLTAPTRPGGAPASSAANPASAPNPAPASAPAVPAGIALDPKAAATAQVLQSMPPAYSGRVILKPETRRGWYAAREAHRAGHHQVVAMIGPSGTAKTHAVHALAAEEGLHVVKFDASGVVEPGDWFGTVALQNGNTLPIPSDLLVAITLQGPRILLIDEMNRANLRALNALLPLLDGSGSVTVPLTGVREPVNPQVMVAITANMGAEYLGVEPLDEAVRTRVLAWLDLDYLSEDDETALLMERVARVPIPGADKATQRQIAALRALTYDPARFTEYDARNLSRLAALIREAAPKGGYPAVSFRALEAAGHLIAAGLPAREAVDLTVVNAYNGAGGATSERAKVGTHVSGILWKAPSASSADADATTARCSACGHTAGEHGIVPGSVTYTNRCTLLTCPCGNYRPNLP